MKEKMTINRPRNSRFGTWTWRVLAILFGMAFLLTSRVASSRLAYAQTGAAGPAGSSTASRQANPLMPPERELAMKIKGPFTLAATGEVIMRLPMGQLADPAFQDLMKHLRDADVAFSNMEGPLIDFDNFAYPTGQGAPRGALADLKSIGIDIMSTANDHSAENLPDMVETIRMLNEGGIAYAGTGRNLQEARAARFLSTPKGSVGLVAAFAVDDARTATATYRDGAIGGRPGLNPLRLTYQGVVTAEQMEALRKIRDSIYARRNEVFAPIPPLPANEPKDRLELFRQQFRLGPRAGDVEYEMNADDLRENMRSIRNGKEYSDFMIASAHVHQGDYAFQTYTYDNDTPDFLVDFAHQAIDNGADVYVGHGVHTLRGIEIYKGKPIFYGLNNLFYQYQSALPQNRGGEMTDAEATMRPGGYAGVRVTQPERMESLVAVSRYENGQLVEVRIYPVDLGQDLTRPFSRVGLPRTPSPEMAKRVLEKMQRISKRFGTNIAIEAGVGVIRVSAR